MSFEFLLKLSEADLRFFTSSIRHKKEQIYTCRSAAVEGLKKRKIPQSSPKLHRFSEVFNHHDRHNHTFA